MTPVVVTSGEPAGIGPDLCLSLCTQDIPMLVLADFDVMAQRKKQLGSPVKLCEWQGQSIDEMLPDNLYICHQAASVSVQAGKLDARNSEYVLGLIETATNLCLQKKASAMVTAPINKAIINEAGIPFSGHTEYLAKLCQSQRVVMMLACDKMWVALATTHLPLAQVAKTITSALLTDIIHIINQALKDYFNLDAPRIVVAGLNPHAGENGYLGREEIDIIEPTIKTLQAEQFNIIGPASADTMYCSQQYQDADVYLAMYHDQGLPVIKYAGFHQTANVTLGLPIIRTSVDHGTALSLAGKNIASADSLRYACQYAWRMANKPGELP